MILEKIKIFYPKIVGNTHIHIIYYNLPLAILIFPHNGLDEEKNYKAAFKKMTKTESCASIQESGHSYHYNKYVKA